MIKAVKVKDLINLARKAGDDIIKLYRTNFGIDYKEDRSPLTEADIISNKIITDELKRLYPEILIISEENRDIPYYKRKNWEYFWLVDPLDGTKEFISRNGEFTVNIALICNGSPSMGVVYVPVKDTIYYGDKDGSFKQEGSNEVIKLKIDKNKKNKGRIIVVASRSHFNKEIESFIMDLGKEYELINAGSSLKFCLVAEGKADIYLRLGPTMEWDTAAAHAIVKFAGGRVYDYKTKKELKYNKESLLNDWFVVE